MKTLKLLTVISLFSLMLTACGENNNNDSNTNVPNATADSMKDMGKNAGNAVEDITDGAGNMVKDAGDAVGRGMKDITK